MNTASTTDARAHARSQAAAAELHQPTLPSDIEPSRITVAQRIPGGGYTNLVLGRGTRVRLHDPHGTACAHVLLLRSDAPWERLNVADTIKVPWQAYLGAGHPLLSDQGRILATLVADTSDHHDTLCGPSAQARHALRMAGMKQGMSSRDIAPGVSFFRGVQVQPDGALTPTGSAGAGAYVDLLVHLPVTVLIANAPHPLDDADTGALDVIAWAAVHELTEPHNTDPEYLRAVDNTETAWQAALLQEA